MILTIYLTGTISYDDVRATPLFVRETLSFFYDDVRATPLFVRETLSFFYDDVRATPLFVREIGGGRNISGA